MPSRNPAWQEFMENYFSFSRAQRRAIVVIILLTAVSIGYSRWNLQRHDGSLGEEPFVVAEVAQQLLVRDTMQPGNFNNYSGESNFTFFNSNQPAFIATTPARLFVFDPNTASMEDFLALGLREKTALNIINYREKGGRFRKPEDLARLYTLKPEEAQRLMPYVRIAEAPTIDNSGQNMEPIEGAVPIEFSKEFPKKERIEMGPVDVNLADSVLWQMLPGIGAKRASSILRYRERLGGFIRVEQVAESYGLPDSVYEKIKPRLQIGSVAIQQLSLNKATETELKNHPYIGWQWAKIIVAYRNQHGNFKTVDDLLKIHVVRKDWLEKVRPYLKVDE